MDGKIKEIMETLSYPESGWPELARDAALEILSQEGEDDPEDFRGGKAVRAGSWILDRLDSETSDWDEADWAINHLCGEELDSWLSEQLSELAGEDGIFFGGWEPVVADGWAVMKA